MAVAQQADAKLQDFFASTDWNMFSDSSDNIEEFTTSVTTIRQCGEDVVDALIDETRGLLMKPMDSRQYLCRAKADYYKGKHSHELPSDANLPGELNAFYTCFESNNTEPGMRTLLSWDTV